MAAALMNLAARRLRARRNAMTLSDLSVRRPVFATVGAIILCVIGIAAFFALPVRELPNVDPPQVSITTTYVGASAEVIEERITQVIESQVSGIQGVDRITSSSRDGASQISILFTLDRNLDEAANDVRDAVSRVLTQLPDQADAPRIAKANADASPIIFITFSSPTMRTAIWCSGSRPFPASPPSTSPARSSIPCASGSTPPRWRRAASPSK